MYGKDSSISSQNRVGARSHKLDHDRSKEYTIDGRFRFNYILLKFDSVFDGPLYIIL